MATSLPDGLRVRAIDWRNADEGDLVRCHALEMAVRAETRPGRAPKPVDAYIRDARLTPPHIEEWVWFVEDTATDDLLGVGECSHEGESMDSRVLFAGLSVRADARRRGIGSFLLSRICDQAQKLGRTSLIGGSSDSCPAGGEFAAARGFRAGIVERESELVLANVDWDMVQKWIDEGPARAPGYDLELTDGPLGEDRYDDLLAFALIMETAPRDDIDIEDWKPTREEIGIWEENFRKSPEVERWMYFIRHRESGACVGGTNVFWANYDPTVVDQGGTCVHPDHRGHALGKWVKAAMLDKIRRERPQADRVRTDNAYSNDPMLGINDALGFKITRSATGWQGDVAAVRAALARGSRE